MMLGFSEEELMNQTFQILPIRDFRSWFEIIRGTCKSAGALSNGEKIHFKKTVVP
jgi:hypothetical protein